MTDQENIDLTNYRNVAIERRGAVLNETITLERTIDIYIASYFCNSDSKKQEMCEQILSTERTSLGHKILIFQALFKRRHPEAEKTNSKLFDDLGIVNKRRNTFAHYQLSLRVEDANHFISTTEVTFIKYTAGIDFKRYSKNNVQQLVDLIFKCTKIINELNGQQA